MAKKDPASQLEQPAQKATKKSTEIDDIFAGKKRKLATNDDSTATATGTAGETGPKPVKKAKKDKIAGTEVKGESEGKGKKSVKAKAEPETVVDPSQALLASAAAATKPAKKKVKVGKKGGKTEGGEKQGAEGDEDEEELRFRDSRGSSSELLIRFFFLLGLRHGLCSDLGLVRYRGKGRRTDDGLPIYDSKELNIGQGGDTPDCPFDCECCECGLKGLKESHDGGFPDRFHRHIYHLRFLVALLGFGEWFFVSSRNGTFVHQMDYTLGLAAQWQLWCGRDYAETTLGLA